MNTQKLKLKKITAFSIFCLLSILSLGQNAKTTAPKLNAANSKTTGIRINYNANAGGIENTAEPVQKQLVQRKAEISDESFSKLWKNEPFGKQDIAKELVEKRDAYSKHFANEDGSISTHIASGPIHYKEKDEWKTIFHTISPTANGFENIYNSHKTYYPASATESLTTVLENGEVLRDMINMKMYFSANGEKAQVKTIHNNKGKADFNQLTYPNVYGNGIDLQLTHETTKRKMDYIIHNREAIGEIPNEATHLIFEETIELPIGWIAELKNNIVFIKDSKGEIQVFYEKPFIEDTPNFDQILNKRKDSKDTKLANNRKTNIRNEGEYSIEQNGTSLIIQTAVAIDWINSEERQFPVKVDPTINVTPNNATNWSRSVANDGYNYSNLYFGNDAGNWVSGSVKFNTSSIGATSIINSIIGYINVINLIGTTYENSPWQFANSADPTTTSGLALFNSMTLGYSNIVVSRPGTGWKSSTFYNPEGNQFVEDALSNGFVNIGVVTGGSYYENEVVEIANHTSANRPYLTINYTTSSTPPSCATPVSPLNGATETAHSGAISWVASGATEYDVYFGLNPNPPLVSTDQTDTFYDIGTCLLPETTYYWKVIPKNEHGSPTDCDTWSFTTDNKLHIYKNDWENASEGFFGTSGESVDGWYANNIAGNASGYQNIWTVGTGSHAINNISAGVTAAQNFVLASEHFMYWEDLGEIYRWIYRPFDVTSLRDIELTFNWKCGGENGQDFGTVASTINGGATWLTDNQGGLYNDGKYWNSPSTVKTQTINLPETRNNTNFQLAFKWNDLSGNGSSSYPSFVVDDITMKGCPYEGTLSSPNETEPFTWIPPTSNTETTITVNGTHECAYFEWEQSIDNGANWIVLSGETSVSYTTPSDLVSNTFYRCRVYFGTGCPGVYQSETFKIVFSPDCTTLIEPAEGANTQSTSIHLSWNEDPLASSYDVYFGEDNPPVTMIDNVADIFIDIEDLDYNTTYYWQIIPTNAGGSASGCDVWSFATGSTPPQFHDYGGTEQITFNNSAYKADNPIFRISHSSTMEEVQIQISQDVTFPGTTVFDGNFIGSFSGENNFETSLEGEVLDNTEFPQGFDTDVLTHGTNPIATNIWFAPEYYSEIDWTGIGGNPDGRVGYSGSWNNYWGNFLRLPEVNCTGQDEVTLTFDVWHSYFATHPNDKLYLSVWADDAYLEIPQTVTINGSPVTAYANTSSSGYVFYFTEERNAANIQVTLDISGITDKSSILLYLNAKCAYNNSDLFYVYFDNVSVTGEAEQLTPGTTYYARAKGKISGSWTDWTTDTFSFTYKDIEDLEWHQTMAPQFLTDDLNGVITETSPDLVTLPASSGTVVNPFTDPSFETGTGWTTYATSGSDIIITASDGANWQSDGSKAGRMYMWTNNSVLSSDVGIISQVVDLTDVEQIVFDAQSHYGPNMFSSLANGGTLRLIIGGTSSNTTGTVYATINHCVSGSSTCSVETLDIIANIDPADRIPNQLVKFVWTGFSSGDIGGALVHFMVDNIRAGVPEIETGILTSTPIHLSSFYEENSWYEFSWNQTLNAGEIEFSIEKENGVDNWEDIVEFTDFSSATVGDNNIDITSLLDTERIRLKATFSETVAIGALPELNSWTIKARNTIINPEPTFDAVDPICEGEALSPLPTTSNEGITGTWAPDLDNTQTTEYTFTPNVGEDATTNTLTITVNENIEPTFSFDTEYCLNATPATLPLISGNGINGTWDIGSINTAIVGTQDYIFTATDAGCYIPTTVTITVNENVEPTFSFGTEYCLNETPPTLPLISGNGITGTWDIGSISTATVGTQDYIFTPTDAGCYIPTTVTITVNDNVEPTFSFGTEYCLNETPSTLPLISGNGITGTWDISAISTTTLGIQDYIFTPTDAGCYIPTTITVTVSTNIEPTFSFDTEYCLNETPAALPLISGNGITGTWDISAINTANLGTQDYIFTPTDAGCYIPTTITVTVNDNIEPTFSFDTEYCLNETPAALPLISGNGINGIWDDGSINTATVGTQDYIFTATDAGCYIPTTITVTVNDNIEPTFSFDTEYCLNETPAALPLISGNGITGTWDVGAINTATVGTQDYIFTATDAGCYIPTTITVTVNPNETPTFDAVGPYCEGSTIPELTTTSNEGITGTWLPAINNMATTEYTFTADAGQCATLTVTLTITVNPNEIPTFDAVAPICEEETLSELPTTSINGITGTWTPALDNTQTTDYTFTPDEDQCATTTTLTIIVNPSITPTFDAVGPYCEGEMISELTTTSNEGITGTWSPEINNTATTEYIFTPDAEGCVTTSTLTITIIDYFDATITSDLSHCHSENSVELTANTIGGTWEGDDIVLLEDQYYFMFQNSEPGEYEIIYHFDGLCGDADTVVFNIIENADATIYPIDTLYVDGEPVVVETAYPNGIWSGDYIIENNLFVPAKSGIGEFDVIYTIEGICGDSDTTEIVVIAAPIEDLLAATVITPDTDGLNDTWKIRGIEAYNNVNIHIFTRWGDEIFAFDGTGVEYADPANQWDGKYNNRELPSGVYVYIMNVDNNKSYKGTISLLR